MKKTNYIIKSVRNLVWITYMGDDNTKGKCLCCNTHEISFWNFHCGHVISRNDNGSNDVKNLRPICQSCNVSMKTQNMMDFMRDYYNRDFKKVVNWYGKNVIVISDTEDDSDAMDISID